MMSVKTSKDDSSLEIIFTNDNTGMNKVKVYIEYEGNYIKGQYEGYPKLYCIVEYSNGNTEECKDFIQKEKNKLFRKKLKNTLYHLHKNNKDYEQFKKIVQTYANGGIEW